LASALQVNTTIVQLVLSGNKEWSLADFCEVLESVSNNENLRILDLSDMDLDDDFLPHVSDFISHSTSLVKVDLSGNFFSLETAREFGTALKNHPSMRHVVLEQCELDDESSQALFEAITPKGFHLERLVLAHNQLSAEFGTWFCGTFLQGNSSLCSCNANGNFFSRPSLALLAQRCDENKAKKSRATSTQNSPERATRLIVGGNLNLLYQVALENHEEKLCPTIESLSKELLVQ
jgi:Ran GTPase-activating protein (RanGAP) involved in mRNA processing and transport